MIVVNATIDTSSTSIEAMKSALAVMEKASQAESGCTDYTFSVEVNNANRLRITECWQDMESLAAHFQTTHMAAFRSAMANYPPDNMVVHFYEAEAVTPSFMQG